MSFGFSTCSCHAHHERLLEATEFSPHHPYRHTCGCPPPVSPPALPELFRFNRIFVCPSFDFPSSVHHIPLSGLSTFHVGTYTAFSTPRSSSTPETHVREVYNISERRLSLPVPAPALRLSVHYPGCLPLLTGLEGECSTLCLVRAEAEQWR